MEIHAHTHTAADSGSHRGSKKWKHYFWEFFMLFLAVTAGFFVENWRHHRLEKTYEKQYMVSLVEDLQSDTTQLTKLIVLFSTVISMEDSLKSALKRPDIMQNPGAAYPYLGYPLDGLAFHRSERTIQQLKNAGGLRLINSIQVSNNINEYDESYRQSMEINGVAIQTYHYYTAILNRVADVNLMDYPYKQMSQDSMISYRWITTDPHELQILYNYTVNFQWISNFYTSQLKGLKKQAEELIIFLRNEYHL